MTNSIDIKNVVYYSPRGFANEWSYYVNVPDNVLEDMFNETSSSVTEFNLAGFREYLKSRGETYATAWIYGQGFNQYVSIGSKDALTVKDTQTLAFGPRKG